MNTSALSDLVNCPICFEIFEEPLILSNCAHTVCSQCVNNLIRTSTSRRTLVCPVCRTASEVPTGGFKKNYSLADIVAKVMAIEASKFVGKWNLVASSNVTMKEEGSGRFTRMLMKALDRVVTSLLGQQMDIEVVGKHWKFTLARKSKNRSVELFLEDGKLVKVVKIESELRSKWIYKRM